MRIIYCISDVCSSDLVARLRAHIAAQPAAEDEGEEEADDDGGDERRPQPLCGPAAYLPGERQGGADQKNGEERHQAVHDGIEGRDVVEVGSTAPRSLTADPGELEGAGEDDACKHAPHGTEEDRAGGRERR